MLYAQIHLTLPPWIHQAVDASKLYADDESKMALAIELSRLNVDRNTGGPFGAAVFTEQGRLVGIGVNRVVAQNCSIAHAEIMAYMTAQQRLQRFRLNEDGTRFIMAASAQPCCQCYGATFWAGVNEILIGARAEDVTELTEFDEGPLPADWVGELNRRGIAVKRDVLREAACVVLRQYRERGGAQY